MCSICGLDCDKVQWLCNRARPDRAAWGTYFWKRNRAAINQSLREGLRDYRGHVWEMEHITPVSEGGGLCGLDNLATLCLRCHKRSTADLARRLADERSGQLRLGAAH